VPDPIASGTRARTLGQPEPRRYRQPRAAHRRLGKRDLEHTIEAAETWIKVAAFACMLDRLAPKPDTQQARNQDRR
jgi:hypothetical protein